VIRTFSGAEMSFCLSSPFFAFREKARKILFFFPCFSVAKSSKSHPKSFCSFWKKRLKHFFFFTALKLRWDYE
jgi:hypothetical protein